jgi:hypothetical protein
MFAEYPRMDVKPLMSQPELTRLNFPTLSARAGPAKESAIDAKENNARRMFWKQVVVE